MLVYVANQNDKYLMSCKQAKARKLLRDGKARVIKRQPFTIQLLWMCEENVQEVIVGIDKGSSVTGFTCVGNDKILLSGNINHRTDVKDKMDSRRGNRRGRRNRKWYRPKRFDNRSSSRRSGRIPPSVKTNVEEVVRVIRNVPLPISKIIVEDVQIDIARLNNPDLKGRDYQKSNRLDENLRIATLMRDDYICKRCNKKNGRLDAHHIRPRSDGGKDTIKNLITLCKSCHKKLHEGKLTIEGGVDGFKDRIAQRTMQGKSHMYQLLNQIGSVSKVFGYQTSAYRKSLDLPKEHDVDSLCIATLESGRNILYDRKNYYDIKFRLRQTRRRYYDLPRKGKGRVKYQVNDSLDGFRKGDVVRVKGKWIKQINSIYSSNRLAFPKKEGRPFEARPKDCRLLERGATIVWSRINI